ncbi:MAG: hypothetical protein JRJ60_04350 [Deltaproteobacteria bacterium]|nr:hypothetical protein [Deltaproteobacteria bacterium]
MARQKVLVPYNFTIQDQKAMDFIMGTFQTVEEMEFTLFHVYEPLPEIETGSNAVLGRLKGTMMSLARDLRGLESYLKGARSKLLDNGFSEERVAYIFKAREKDIADEIAETALKGGYHMVLLNRKPTKITRMFGRSISGKLLSTLKDTAICIMN